MRKIAKPKTLLWTTHSRYKMRHYGLSEQKIKSVLNSPKRVEKGIADGTIAFLLSAGSVKHPHEIWVMVADDKDKRRVISAWRYPGVTKPGEPLPDQIVREMEVLAGE